MERDIKGKAIHAAINLGKGDLNLRGSGEASSDRVMTNRVYATTFGLLGERRKLIIAYRNTVYNDAGEYSTLKITVDEDTVFDQRGDDLDGYRPGTWEAELDRIQEEAADAEALTATRAKDREIAAEKESAAAVRRAWGLDDAA